MGPSGLVRGPCRDGFRQKVPKTGALSFFQGLYDSPGTLPEVMSRPLTPSSWNSKSTASGS